MATFAEKLIAYVGADLSEYVKKVGSDLPRIAKSAASAISQIGRVAQTAFSLVGRAANLALAPLRAVASAIRSVVVATWDLAKSAVQVVWTNLKRGAAVAAGAIGLATREAISFEAAMAQVWTQLDAGPARLAEISKDIRRLAVQFGQAPVEMAAAAKLALGSGIGESKLAGFLEVASEAAVAGATDARSAVGVLTAVLNAYDMKTERARHVSDILFATVREGTAEFIDLARSLGTVLPAAVQAGIPLEHLGAAVATLTKAGMSADEVITQLRATLVSILAPSADAVQAAQELGVGFNQDYLLALGLPGLLKRIGDAVGGDSDALQRFFPNVRALTAVMALGGGQAEEFARQLKIIGNSAGATNENFVKVSGTAEFKISEAWRKIGEAGIEIGGVFSAVTVSTVQSIADWATKLAEWVTANSGEIQKTWDKLVNWLYDQWKWLGFVFREICYEMGLDGTDPWLAIETAAGLAWDWIVGLWDDLKSVLGEVCGAIQGDHDTLWDAVKSKAKEAWDFMVGLWEELEPALKPLWAAALAALGGDWEKALKKLGTSAEKLTEIMIRIVKWLGRVVMPIAVKIGVTIAKAMLSVIWSEVSSGLGKLANLAAGIAGNPIALANIVGPIAASMAQEGASAGEASETESPALDMADPANDFYVPALAEGGIVRKPTLAMIGEKGPEAVVPLGKGGGGRQVVVNQTFNYRTDRREAEHLAELTRRLQGRGRLGYAY